jgi:hypothetical protein
MYAPVRSAHFDVTGIAIGRARAQNILGAMPGSAESAPKRRHRPELREEQDWIYYRFGRSGMCSYEAPEFRVRST